MVPAQLSNAVRSFRLASALFASVHLAVTVCQAAEDDEQPGSSPPPAIETLLRWFPEKTETFVAAQSFKISPSRHDNQTDLQEPLWDRIRALSLCGLSELDLSAGLAQLVDQEVAVAINGGRDFSFVSAFGSLRYQGCSIVRFKDPLPDDGRKLIDALRKGSKAARRIAGTEVFVFPDRTVRESTVKLKKWQGQYLALPSADTLLCASSDEFLREVLERSKGAPADRAPEMALPEWTYIDTAAPLWAVRHIPRKLPGQLAAGVTWCLKPQGRNVFEVTYIPIEGEDPLPLAEIWKKPELDANPSIDEKDDGRVVVTIDLEKEKQQLWYAFAIYWSIGEIGQPQSSLQPADLVKLVDRDDAADDVEETPNRETANLPPDCLEELWSKEGEVYSGVSVAADGKTIVALRNQFADIFDVSGNRNRSIKLPDRRSRVRWARLAGAMPGELIIFDEWGEGLIALSTDATKLWDQTPGQGIDDAWAADLDGDGKDEVIVGYNGSTGLQVFNGDGSRRWKDRSIGNVWHVTAGDIDGDGNSEVLAASGKIHVFNGDGDKVSALDPGMEATMVRAFRLPGESADRILVVGRGSQDAQMIALNVQGERLWRTNLPHGVNTCASVAIAPGSKWAAAGSMGSVVWLTDVSTGKILGARPKLGFPDVAWILGADKVPLLLVASTSGLAAFRVKERDAIEPDK